MLKNLLLIGAGWFIYTREGRKVATTVGKNLIPLAEKELGISIVEPIKKLFQEKEE